MHPLGRPPFPSKVIIHRGLALLAATFVPSGRLSNLVGGEKRLFHGPDSLARTFSSSNPAMTIKAASTFADELGKYAKQLRGEWSMEPSVALDRLVPELDGGKHKGQLGRVGVFGGSKDYTGAPFYASISSLRMGADLAYVFTAQEAAPAIKTYSPELMVTPVYSAADLADRGEAATHQAVAAVVAVLPKLHSLLLGPGMGRDPHVLQAAAEIVAKASTRTLPVVLDADSIAMVVQNPDSVRGFPLAVLTPNANEFRLLCERMERDMAEQGSCPPIEGGAAITSEDNVGKKQEAESKAATVERLAVFLGGVTIVLKGEVDIISNGSRTIACAVPGGLKRCGGIGDVLSGAMVTSLAWVSLSQRSETRESEELRLWAAWWACAVTRHASRRGYEAYGRAMSASNVYERIGGVMEDIAPSPAVGDLI